MFRLFTVHKSGRPGLFASSVVSRPSSVAFPSQGQRRRWLIAVRKGEESSRTKGIGRPLNIFVYHLFLSRPRQASKHLSIQPSSALLSLTDHVHLAHALTSQSARIDGLGGNMGRRQGGSSSSPCRLPTCDPCPSSSPHCAPLPCLSAHHLSGLCRYSGLPEVLQRYCRGESELPHSSICPAPNCISACSLRVGYLGT